MLIEVDAAGRLAAVHDEAPSGLAGRYEAAGRLTTLGPHQLLLPGLVDLHIHAPQFLNVGTALDLPLEQWLRDYTFPLESRFADTGFATGVYDRLGGDPGWPTAPRRRSISAPFT